VNQIQYSNFGATLSFKNLEKIQLPPEPPDAQQEFYRILENLVSDYGAEKIIVFGSCAHGCSDLHSDVDLCVIRKHPLDCTRPAYEARLAAGKSTPRLSRDILVRTPAQWDAVQKQPFGVFQEICENGVVVYER